MSEFKYMEELDKKLENIKYKEKLVNIEIYLNQALQVSGYYKDSPINEKIEFIKDGLLTLLDHIKKIKETKKKYDKKKLIKSIVNYYNKHIINKLKETINKEPEGLNKKDLNRLDELLPRLEEEEEPEQPKPKQPKPKPEEEPKQKKPPKLLSSSGSEDEEEEPEQPKIKKEINYKIDELLNKYSQLVENPEYIDALGHDFFKFEVEDVIKDFEKLKENIAKYNPEAAYKKYKDIVFKYNTSIKHNIKVMNAMTKNEQRKILLNEILSLLPDLEIKNPEPEQQTKPEQPIKGINSTWTQPPLNERITRPNPEAPPTTTVSKTPIDDFIEPKQEPDEEEEEEEEEPEQQQQPAAQQLIPVNNSQQIVQSPKENFKIAERDIEEFKNNPQLDIIKGVGDLIEFIATSNLTDEMTDELIDQMLDLKDSHGNLLFNNRFQIEDLIINRMKRRRIKYLLPKRIIRAEKPDEQKLIINPMLRRGRIASMTSAKERYYNYI